jgi:hypothetical protein
MDTLSTQPLRSTATFPETTAGPSGPTLKLKVSVLTLVTSPVAKNSQFLDTVSTELISAFSLMELLAKSPSPSAAKLHA